MIVSKVIGLGSISTTVSGEVTTANPFDLLNDENVLEKMSFDCHIVNQALKASTFHIW